MSLGTLAVLIAVSVALIVYALVPRKADKEETLQRRMTGRRRNDTTELPRKPAKRSMAKTVMDKVAPLAVKPAFNRSDADMSRLRVRLATAGLRRENATVLFLASKSILAVGFALVAIIWMVARGNPLSEIAAVTVFAAAVGFMGPDLWLKSAAQKRGQQIRNGLPDSLDLLVISVEAGLGLDAAIQRVGDEMKHVHPTLSEEFQTASMEGQMGIPRAEALENMAQRTGVSEVKSLVAIVNQAERFGSSVAKALRNQADALRVKRRQLAEERAQKTAIKLMAPLILFIFPAIFVVLAGPAAIKIIEMMKQRPGTF